MRIPNRISLLDRPWTSTVGGAYSSPLRVPSVDELRNVLLQVMAARPHSVFACRIDLSRNRWIPVPAHAREEHVERMVRAGDDLGLDSVDDYLVRHRSDLPPECPLRVHLGPTSILQWTNHVIGDAVTSSALGAALVRADANALIALDTRAKAPLIVRSILRETARHPGIVSAMAHDLQAAPPPRSADHPADASGPPMPMVAYRIIESSDFEDLTRWRSAHAPDATMASVFTAACYRAFTAAGVSVLGSSFNTLVSVRRYLPAKQQQIAGNLARPLFLSADLRDPTSISAATARALASRRALFSIGDGLMRSAAARYRRAPVGEPASTPLTLTVSWTPSVADDESWPWIAGQPRVRASIGYSSDPAHIVVSVGRQQDDLRLQAWFHSPPYDADLVRRALDDLRTPVAALAS